MLRDNRRRHELRYAIPSVPQGNPLTTTSGASVAQSPLIMPVFQMPSVPTHISSLQVAKLVHDSEYYFPPLNMACTLSNIALTVACYLNRRNSQAAADKLPWVALALACSVATTAFALLIMVPRNKRMTFLSVEMNKHMQGGKDEKEFRQIQVQWRKLNYGKSSAAFWCGRDMILTADRSRDIHARECYGKHVCRASLKND